MLNQTETAAGTVQDADTTAPREGRDVPWKEQLREQEHFHDEREQFQTQTLQEQLMEHMATGTADGVGRAEHVATGTGRQIYLAACPPESWN